jgi:radical SAM superfamily enzyme YgiQ (UPF0313 family)
MKILIVYPEYPVTFWSFKYALEFVHEKSNLPPLGVLTVASMLPEEWNVRLVDMNVRKLRDKDISWADYVFISAMNIQEASARSVIERCKKLSRKTVCGGPLFSIDTQKFDDVDHLLLYEGEKCIPQFIEDLENGCPKHIYDLQSYPDLSETPIPRWDLIDIRDYSILSVQYSRGCPFHCDFCNVVSLFGHVPRTKTSQQILTELQAIYDLGWRGSIFFVDDNFIGNKRKLKEDVLPALVDWMKARDYPFTFFTEASINMADDEELMQLMVDAGFDNVFVGIETVDEDCLAECNKSQNVNRSLLESVRTIQQHGMQVQGGFILGFDNDKPSIFQRMPEFIQKSGIVTAMVGVLSAPTGTELYERMKRENRLINDFTGINNDSDIRNDINFTPKMGLDKLKSGYEKVIDAIYSPANYYRRVKTFLENYRPQGKHTRPLRPGDVGAFFKAYFKLGIVDKGHKEFHALMRWAKHQDMRTYVQALTFSIYGYHFRKCLIN